MTTTANYEDRIGRPESRPDGQARSVRRGRHRRRRAQSGASLIEIMVVLIILLVGVFLAIRIFPAGFGVLAANDNRSRAVRLAEQLIGDTQNNAANLPQGVLMEGPTTSGADQPLNPILNQDPDLLTTYTFADNSTASDVNRARYIKGEPIKIPVATATIKSEDGSTNFPASQYILRFGPIALDSKITPDNATATPSALEASYLKIMSAPLVSYTVASNNPTITAQPGTMTTPIAYSTAPPLGPDGITNVSGYLRGQTSYLIDYASTNLPALIMFEGGADNVNGVTFYVSYSYRDSTGALQSVTDAQLYVNQGTPVPPATLPTPVWQGLPLPSPSSGVATNVLPGSVSVRRAFTRVAYPNSSTSPWSMTNPYQYILGQSNAPSGTSVNQGQIYFNPAGANYSVPTPTGQQPFLAYADYSVLDWHILHDDVQVPSVDSGMLGLIPVKTSFNLIKRAGDANPDQTIYAGLYPLDTNATDISVVDLATGTVYNTSGNVIHGNPNPALTSSPPLPFYIDTDPHQGTYVTGTVYINPSVIARGSQIRILYKAEGDWAVSLQKAYSQYLPIIGAVSPPNWINTADGTGTTGTFNSFSVDGPNHRIYFPRADLNKAVVVTLQYTTGSTSTSYVRTAPLQFTIDQASGSYAYIDLVSNGTVNSQVLSNADRTGIAGASSAWSVVGPILGVSVKARVIYKDNNNTNNSWRIQDVDSYLTPAS